MKKMLTVAMAAFMALGLVACGTDAQKTGKDTSTSTETSVSTEASVDAVKVDAVLSEEVVANLLAEYKLENETYVKYVVANTIWAEVDSDETEEADFVKIVEANGKKTVFHAMVAGGVNFGEIHTAKAKKSNDFYKLGLKGCTTKEESGVIAYDFSYDLTTCGIDLAEMAKALKAAE